MCGTEIEALMLRFYSIILFKWRITLKWTVLKSSLDRKMTYWKSILFVLTDILVLQCINLRTRIDIKNVLMIGWNITQLSYWCIILRTNGVIGLSSVDTELMVWLDNLWLTNFQLKFLCFNPSYCVATILSSVRRYKLLIFIYLFYYHLNIKQHWSNVCFERFN